MNGMVKKMAGKKTHEAGQRLARRRRQVTAACEACGAKITGLVTRRYCGNACRLRASRQRRRGSLDGALPPIILRLNAAAARVARAGVVMDLGEILPRSSEASAAEQRSAP